MLVLYLLVQTVYGNALAMSVNNVVNIKLIVAQQLQRIILWLCFQRNFIGLDHFIDWNFVLEIAILLVMYIKQIYENGIFVADYRID
jgi:hypothetical protein